MRRKDTLFTHVPTAKVRRNLFDLSHEVKMTGKFGYLYPMLVMETLPGDIVKDQSTIFMRCAPLLFPVMHNVRLQTHFFFVPNRLLTDAWENFITAGREGEDEPVLPYVTPQGIVTATGGNAGTHMLEGTLWDYMGLPACEETPGADAWSNQHISILPFRAYAKIRNDWYKDPNLSDDLDLDLELEGDVSATSVANGMFTLRVHMWRRDYFTSALPEAQRGPEVLMPLAGTGSVQYRPQAEGITGEASTAVGLSPTSLFVSDFGGTPTALGIANILNDEIQLDSSDVSINDLRLALAMQAWMETNARGGPRYVEQIKSHFGVTVPDFRLDRSEYLGGGSQNVQISEVLATATTDDATLADMGGRGVSFGKSNGFSYMCKEHGFVIGIVTITPDTNYMQGIHRMWTRESRFDYAFPLLAHLGEQEIVSRELFYSYAEASDAGNAGVFGYIPRYAEYKYLNDRISGEFRTSMIDWHLARRFNGRPVLSSNFTGMLENSTAFEESYRRIFVVQDGTDYLWIQIYHKCRAQRPLPYFGVPRLIG